MLMQTVTTRKNRVFVAGALALLSQGAVSGDASLTGYEPEILTVTAQRSQIEASERRIEADLKEQDEALNRRFAEDLKKSLDAIDESRIELAILEVPTRG